MVFMFIVEPQVAYLQKLHIAYESLSSPWGVIIRPTSGGVIKP